MPRTFLAGAFGFSAALAAGWVVFPRLLYERQPQPVAYRHKTHAAKSGTSACTECHTVRADGAFTGIPRTESCAVCHAEPMGTSPAESTLVRNFVKQHRDVPWLVYAGQPANVRFSHAIHTRRAGLACKVCHGVHGDSDIVSIYERNRISGYSRDIGDGRSRGCGVRRPRQ